MKKIILSFCFFSFLSLSSIAQQLPQYSQYLLNKYVINPASAGTENYFLGQTNYRSQWDGIKDAPRTYILSVNGPLNDVMGIGGYIFSDVTGPTRRTGFSLSYAYHVRLNSDLKLSMAINGGLLQYSVDGSEITFADPDDNLNSPSQESNLFPDAGFSLYLYGDNFFFGASAPQLIRNQLDFDNSIEDPTGRLTSHYFITGGYTYSINSDFDIEPSVLLKYVEPVPLSYELSLRGLYKKTAWLGFSYRRSDALVLLLGYTLQQNLSIGYSYDIIQSDIRNYSSGSHEIMLSIKFNKKKTTLKDIEE